MGRAANLLPNEASVKTQESPVTATDGGLDGGPKGLDDGLRFFK